MCLHGSWTSPRTNINKPLMEEIPLDSPVHCRPRWGNWTHWRGEVEGEEEEEAEGETERWADRRSPRGEPGGAGRLPREAERRRQGAGHGIRGEGPASHHPMGEEEAAGSLKVSTHWLEAGTFERFFFFHLQCVNKYWREMTANCSKIPTVFISNNVQTLNNDEEWWFD